MKKYLISALLLLVPALGFAAQSLDLELTSSQYAYKTDTASLSVSGDMTLETWVKLESDPSNSCMTLFAKDNNTGNQRGYSLRYCDGVLRPAGTKNFIMSISRLGTDRVNVTVDYALTAGTWTHVAAVYTAASGQFELFINGVSQGTATGLPTSQYNNSATLYLGAFLDTGSVGTFWDGKLYMARIWGATRTAGNLSGNWCTALGSTTNLSAEWTLDNTYADNSGNSNTLTAANTPVFAADIPSACVSYVPPDDGFITFQ